MPISYIEAIEREERNQADAARLIRDDEAESCAKIADAQECPTVAIRIRERIFARAEEARRKGDF